MKKVSIIIPNYNGEEYIERCIESVLSQDYSEKEIIVVDDGSTDKSIDIIKKYAKKHDYIKFFRIKRIRLNLVRKVGLGHASGDYIMFLDSDDFLRDGAISIAVRAMEENDVSVVRFESEYYPSGRTVAQLLKANESAKIIYHEEIIRLLATGFKLTSVWSKLYKKDVFENTKAFEVGIDLGEDLMISSDVLSKLDKILLIPNVLYNYFENNASITRAAKREQIVGNVKERIFMSEKMLKFVANNISDNREMDDEIYEQMNVIWVITKRLAKIKNYKKKDFLEDFDKVVMCGESCDIDMDRLYAYVAKMNLLEKIQDGYPTLAIARNDKNAIWRNILIYKIARKILRRGK